MKILITGALGHIGSYIIRKLSIDFPNSKLILVDNLMTQRYSSLFDLPKNLNYKFIEADVLDINLSNNNLYCKKIVKVTAEELELHKNYLKKNLKRNFF